MAIEQKRLKLLKEEYSETIVQQDQRSRHCCMWSDKTVPYVSRDENDE